MTAHLRIPLVTSLALLAACRAEPKDPTVDAPPGITGVTITADADDAHNDSTLNCDAEASDAEDGPLDPALAWTNETTGTGLGTDAELVLSAAVATPGDIISCTATATDSAGATATDTATVTLANRAPTLDTPTVEPAAPTTLQDVACSVAEPTDPDEDEVSVTVSWQRDGAAAGMGDAIAAPHDVGEVLTCVATATDARGATASTTADAVVGNTPPMVDSVVVSPVEARVGESLTCMATASDADGDTPTLRYTWTDGTTGDTYTVQAADDPGETLTCTATATDAHGDTAQGTATATVLNTEPVVDSVSITPASATNDDTLTCAATASDADGDAPALSHAWTGSTAGSLGTGDTLDLSATSVESLETVTCTVTAADPDGGTGTGGADRVLTNRDPAVTATLTPATGATRADSLTCTTSAVDDDGDAVTVSHAWTVDGAATPATSGTASTSTLGGAFEKGDAVTCTATATDGKGGTATGATSTTIANTPPGAPVVEITPSAPAPGDTLTCVVDTPSTDADGDAVTYTMAWTVDGVAYEAGGTADTGGLDTGDPGWLGPSTTTWTDDTVDGADVGGAETWTCTATPDDGDDEGTAATASVETAEDDTPCHAIQLTDLDASMPTPATGLSMGTGPWTFEFWIKADAAFSGASRTSTTVFMMNESYSAYAFRAFYYTDTGEVRCYTYNNTSGSHNLDNGYVGVIDDGEWHHVGCSYSGGTLRMFLDGVATGTDSGNPSLSGSSNFVFGEPRSGIYASYEPAPISLGPTRISNTARYTTDFTPSQSWSVDGNTVAQWLVADGFDGTTLVDEAGGNNNGTVRNSISAVGRCD